MRAVFMNEKIEKLVIELLQQLLNELEKQPCPALNSQTQLLGHNGTLDSLELVSLIADLEEKIYNQFDQHIVLADEKAMSRTKSPFRDVAALVEYIEEQLQEEKWAKLQS